MPFAKLCGILVDQMGADKQILYFINTFIFITFQFIHLFNLFTALSSRLHRFVTHPSVVDIIN